MRYSTTTPQRWRPGLLLIALVSAVGFSGPGGRAETPSPGPPALPFHAEAIRDEVSVLVLQDLLQRGDSVGDLDGRGRQAGDHQPQKEREESAG